MMITSWLNLAVISLFSPYPTGTRKRLRLFATILSVVLCALSFRANASAQSDWQVIPAYSDAVSMRQGAALRAVDFDPSGQRGIAVGDCGVILLSEDGGQTWQLQPNDVQCGLSDVAWLSAQHLVAVGGYYDRITKLSRAVVVCSDDGGHRWYRAADNELPRLSSLKVRNDDRAAIALGDWSPISRSREYISHDRGRTWASSGELDGVSNPVAETNSAVRHAWATATGESTVIRDVYTVNEGTLIAVGDHGIIVRGTKTPATNEGTNGAISWTTVRGEERRASILVIAKDKTTAPWSLIGTEALEMRQRVAILMEPLRRRNSTTAFELLRDASRELALTRQAASMLAAASADFLGFDTTPNDPQTTAMQYQEEAKNWLAIHRPAVLVLDESLDEQLSSAFLQVAMAAGVTRIVRYHFGVNGRGANGDTLMHRSAMMPKTGTLAGDFSEDALHCIAPATMTPNTLALRTLYDASVNPARGESVTAGIPIQTGQRLSADTAKANRRQLQILQARINESKRIDQLIRGSRGADQFASSLRMLLDQTAADDRLRLAWTIHKRIESFDLEVQPRSIAMQERSLSECASRFHDISFGKWASLRLQAIQESSEWQKLRETTALTLAGMPIDDEKTPVQQAAVSPFQEQTGGVRQASEITPLLVSETSPVSVGPKQTVKQTEVDLAWEFHPLKLLAAEAQRQRGRDETLQPVQDVSGNFHRLLEDASPNAWSTLLSESSKQAIRAVKTAQRPKLDGRDDESFWQSPMRAPTSDDSPLPALRVAHDEQFVYLFIRSEASRLKHDFDASGSSKNRDYPLETADRLRILIDTDLDLMTSFQLETTISGKTRDSVDGQTAWQPTWYVAVNHDNELVNFEIAIRRSDLVDLPLTTGQSWFVTANIVPRNQGVLSDPIADPRKWQRVDF